MNMKDKGGKMKKDDLLLCAFRYCLGRRSYIVSSMTSHLGDVWDEISPNFQNMIRREIDEAIDKDYVGDKCDRDSWLDLLEKVQKDM